MSGSSGPRLYQWSDRSPAANHCLALDNPLNGGMWSGGVPFPSPGSESPASEGREIAYQGLRYYADTGDGKPGLLMCDPMSGESLASGLGIQLAQKSPASLGPKVGPMQPNSVAMFVVQRCTPSLYPWYESFEGLGVGGEGYAAFFGGAIVPYTAAPTPDPSELMPFFNFGGVDPGFSGGPGFSVYLGDGTNYGWGARFQDASDLFMGMGTVLLNDTLKHILTVEVVGNSNVTLWTDGEPEILTTDSGGAGAPTGGSPYFNGYFADMIGRSCIAKSMGAGLADDVRDGAYLKAAISYVGTMSFSEKSGIWQYLRSRWGTV